MAVNEDYIAQLNAECDNLGKSFVNATRLLQAEIENVQSGKKSKDLIDILSNKPVKIIQRIRLPVNEHPKANFIGRLLGPKGSTLKQLQESTGIRMNILGKGSVRDQNKVEELLKSGDAKFDHLREELHLQISVLGDADHGFIRLGHAVTEIKNILMPLLEGGEDGGRDSIGMTTSPAPRGRGGSRGGAPLLGHGGLVSPRGGIGSSRGGMAPPGRGAPLMRGSPSGRGMVRGSSRGSPAMRGGPSPRGAPIQRGGGRGGAPMAMQQTAYDDFGYQPQQVSQQQPVQAPVQQQPMQQQSQGYAYNGNDDYQSQGQTSYQGQPQQQQYESQQDVYQDSFQDSYQNSYQEPYQEQTNGQYMQQKPVVQQYGSGTKSYGSQGSGGGGGVGKMPVTRGRGTVGRPHPYGGAPQRGGVQGAPRGGGNYF